jgi:hypothetical protein
MTALYFRGTEIQNKVSQTASPSQIQQNSDISQAMMLVLQLLVLSLLCLQAISYVFAMLRRSKQALC